MGETLPVVELAQVGSATNKSTMSISLADQLALPGSPLKALLLLF